MKKLFLLAVLPVLLTGCGSSVKQTLGLERVTPDEFSVVERAPLTVPPEFDLVPPKDGAPEPVTATRDARNLVLGSQTNAPAMTGASRAESILLQKAGQGDPAIRQQLAVEKDDAAPETAAQKLGIVPSDKKGKALDAAAEATRLQQQNIKTPPVKIKAPDKETE